MKNTSNVQHFTALCVDSEVPASFKENRFIKAFRKTTTQAAYFKNFFSKMSKTELLSKPFPDRQSISNRTKGPRFLRTWAALSAAASRRPDRYWLAATLQSSHSERPTVYFNQPWTFTFNVCCNGRSSTPCCWLHWSKFNWFCSQSIAEGEAFLPRVSLLYQAVGQKPQKWPREGQRGPTDV